MKEEELHALKFPIGRFSRPKEFSKELRESWIGTIEVFAERLLDLTKGLNKEQLNWNYRPGGWSVKQVVHHCADSHMNSLIRFKLALTEETPTIKAYYEDRWAELGDSLSDDLSDVLLLISGLHRKWVVLLKSMSEQDFEKDFVHPESGRYISLHVNLALYAWHCEHHLAHIRQAIEHQGQFNT